MPEASRSTGARRAARQSHGFAAPAPPSATRTHPAPPQRGQLGSPTGSDTRGIVAPARALSARRRRPKRALRARRLRRELPAHERPLLDSHERDRAVDAATMVALELTE